MMAALDAMSGDAAMVGKELSHGGKTYKIAKIDNFEYTDPIDGAVAKKQVSFSLRAFLYLSNFFFFFLFCEVCLQKISLYQFYMFTLLIFLFTLYLIFYKTP